jgi:CelD/BcsL family acetyltransferase involved in cellulose biosynthesis/GNAT superfamily N-acetyltransferase
MDGFRMNVELVEGFEAEALLADGAFREQWAGLAALCPWATVYQGPGFCSAWYRAYRGRYAPVLVMSRGIDGQFDGLLALAESEAEGRFGVAGLWQAEYQCWLCRPELAEEFPPLAMARVRDRLPGGRLRFQYLPGNAPIGWLGRGRMNRLIERFKRPVLRLQEVVPDAATKSTNWRCFRNLARNGTIEVTPVANAEELEQFFNKAISWYDIRRLAINNSAPFGDDPRKRAFHFEMMREPELTRVTKLTTGGKLASFQFQLCDGEGIRMHVFAHDPMLAQQSPGRVHARLLAEAFTAEGYRWLDLTAGGEGYKEELANGHDTVLGLTIFASRRRWATGLIGRGTRRAAMAGLKMTRISPMKARLRLTQLRRLGLAGLTLGTVRRGAGWLSSRKHTLLYWRKTQASANGAASAFNRDSPNDLLAYEPPPGWVSRHEFAADALERIARRQRCYTFVEKGRLLHVAWLIERPSPTRQADHVPGVTLPADSAVITWMETIPEARRRGLASRALDAMARDATGRGIKRLYVSVPARDGAAVSLIEKSGFVLQQQMVQSVRFGRRSVREVAHQSPAGPGLPDCVTQPSDA